MHGSLDARDWRDACLVVAGSAALYVLLGQDTFYKIDGHLYLSYVLNGERSYPRHFLYLPMVFAARDLGVAVGLSLYESARLLSAFGAAVGAGLLHLASRMLPLPRAQAFSVTLLSATLPATMFFASVVEVHGPFLPFVGLVAVAAARLARQPSLRRSIALGLACALAFGAHSTAALLPAVFLPLLLLYPARPFRAGLLPGATTAMALVAGIAASPLLARLVQVDFDLRHSSEFATDRAARNFTGAWRYGSTLYHEWLLPLLPASVLLPLGLATRRARAGAAWLLLAGLIYLGTAQMILGGEPEWGAYLLPFAWPIALWLRQWLPPMALWGVAGVQLAAGITAVLRHDDPGPTRAYAHAVRALANDRPIAVLAADDLDLQALLLHLPQAQRLPLFEAARLPAAGAEQASATLQRLIDDLLARDIAVVLSDGARARVLAYPEVTPCGAALLQTIDARYRLERSAHAGFAGCRLRSK